MKSLKLLVEIFSIGVLLLIILGCANTSANIAAGTVTTTETGITSLSKHFVINNKSLARSIEILDVQATNVDDLLKVQAKVKNRKKKTLNFEYQIEWFNKDGFKIDYPVQMWHPMLIYGLEEAYLQGVSPDSRARSFKIHVRKPQPL